MRDALKNSVIVLAGPQGSGRSALAALIQNIAPVGDVVVWEDVDPARLPGREWLTNDRLHIIITNVPYHDWPADAQRAVFGWHFLMAAT